MSARARTIDAFRCPAGRLFLSEHAECPHCGRPLTAVRTPAAARLVSHTTVRVNPTGVPYRLGVAVNRHGAATLCIVEGNVRGNGREWVTLVLRGGRYHALGAGARVSRSPAPPSSDAGSQRS